MKKPEIKVINEIVVYENQYGKLYDDDVMFIPQEQPGKYIRWKWNRSYSVAILPVMKNGDFVLIENFRHAARKSVVETPKGYGEDGVLPLDMAKQELADETGLTSNHWEYLGEVLTDTSFTYHPMKLFIAWDCEHTAMEDHEDSEVIMAQHVYPLSSVPEITKSFSIYDAVTLILLMYAYQRR